MTGLNLLHILRRALKRSLLLAGLGLTALAPVQSASSDSRIVPVIEGPWWTVASTPDLGRYNSAKPEPVDFALWQAADGSWQLWSCIRNTGCGGHTRLLYGWESQRLTDPDWKPQGIKMESRPDLGEAPGGLQAPHVVRQDGLYWMAYGDWDDICFATSRDGKTFERIVQPDGRTALFGEGSASNTRDPMMIKIQGAWHLYYTAILGGRGYGLCRTSMDLKHWGWPVVVSYGGRPGNGPWFNECPQVVEVTPGEFVYFRNQLYGAGQKNFAYYSRNPLNFGVDDDSGLVAELPIAAPEIVTLDGKDYIAALKPTLDGIQIAHLRWGRVEDHGAPVFDFDSPAGRAGWKQVEGNLDPLFCAAPHADFAAPTRHVIGTAERLGGGFDDTRTGVIESPVFTLDAPAYDLLVGGGDQSAKTYVALIDAESGAELARYCGARANAAERKTFACGQSRGRQARLRIVDKATGPWGHVNFGGIFAAPKPVIFR